jgi:hypothetical protein
LRCLAGQLGHFVRQRLGLGRSQRF